MNDWFSPCLWQLAHGRSLQLGPKALIMGILNVTPDSFSDGGLYDRVDQALAHALKMQEQGAVILDVGGESTRPGAAKVDALSEQKRVLPVIEQLADQSDAIISIDTYRSETARLAVQAGAHIVNDVWGCQKDKEIAKVAVETGAGLVAMSTRRGRPVLDNIIEDALAFLTRSIAITQAAGLPAENLVIDPGFGFSETIDHDIPLLNGLQELMALETPMLIGTSRKRFLGAITGRDAAERGAATAATSALARMKGAALFRVHDIEQNKDALAVADAMIENMKGATKP